jgi:trehalose 6-phosphate synthase
MADDESQEQRCRKNGEGIRFVAVSNRLPVVLERTPENGWRARSSPGGLVTALAPVLRDRGGMWIGWPGTTEQTDLTTPMEAASRDTGYRLHPVALTEEEVEGFYHGFANSVLWPLFHDLVTRCDFSPEFWHTFEQVNRKFAQAIQTRSRANDYIWVQDYHLVAVGRHLRALGVERKCGFFLHIPFPPLEVFFKLPWRAQILRSLLDYDLVGFHTLRDRRNFLECVKALVPGVRTSGKGSVITAHCPGRDVRVGSFPIGIDYGEISARAASREVVKATRQLAEELRGQCIVLGADRLDYTKGIPERLQAFRNALRRYPELRGKITLIQLVSPSRVGVPEYENLRGEIERLVGEINGEFTELGRVPIHYRYRNLPRDELLAHCRVADIALVTPLRDGMNLVAKEYCACQVDENGVLILSEFAGAAAQLHRWASMVNPYDVEGVADAIREAFAMDPGERKRRMRGLRESIRRHNIFRWVDSFLRASISKRLDDFPVSDEYVPPLESEDLADSGSSGS